MLTTLLLVRRCPASFYSFLFSGLEDTIRHGLFISRFTNIPSIAYRRRKSLHEPDLGEKIQTMLTLTETLKTLNIDTCTVATR